METKAPLTQKAAPAVRDFADPLRFLAAVYEWRKTGEIGFSYEAWSRELGLNGRSFLRLLVLGQRRFTDAIAHQVASGLGLSAKDAAHFLDLIKFAQAKTTAERDFYFARIERTTRQETKKLGGYRFLGNPLTPRVQSLLAVEGLQKTTAHLAATLKVSVKECEQALEGLEAQGLARREKNTWTSDVKNFRVDAELGGKAIQSFHRKSLTDAIAAIDLPPATRDFQSAVVLLSKEEYESVREEMKASLLEILAKYDRPSKTTGTLYQINTNTIPVSQALATGGPILNLNSFKGDFDETHD